MTLAVLVLNAAYVALLASTFTRTLVWLRVALVLAAIAFIVFGLLESILSMVLWNIAIGSMHLFRIARDYRRQRSVVLTPEESSIRDEFFPTLGDFDFHLLWCMGSPAHFESQVVIETGSLPDTVSLVLDGTAIVQNNGLTTRGIRRGGLVGEMSFVSGLPADVDVVASGPLTVYQWDQRRLASLDQLHPVSARAFRQLLSRDLVAKARV